MPVLLKFLPLLIEIWKELFNTDGGQKVGLGLKVSLLFNIMFISTSIYLVRIDFDQISANVRLSARVEMLDGKVTEKDDMIKGLKERVATLESNSSKPSYDGDKTYNQTIKVAKDKERDQEFIRKLESIANR